MYKYIYIVYTIYIYVVKMGLGVVTDWFGKVYSLFTKICIKCYFGRSYKVNSILFIPVLGELY